MSVESLGKINNCISILCTSIENLDSSTDQDLIDKIEHIKSGIDLSKDKLDYKIYETIKTELAMKGKFRREEVVDAVKNLSIEVG
jgi:hypothetical protein